MAKISTLPAVATLDGTETLPLVRGGAMQRAPLSLVTQGIWQGLLTAYFTIPGFITPTGAVDNTTTPGVWRSTPFLDVNYFKATDILLKGDPGAATISYYSKAKVLLDKVSAAVAGGFVSALPAEPAGTAYIRFCAPTPFTGQRFLAWAKIDRLPPSRLDAGRIGMGNLFTLATGRGYLTTASPPLIRDDVNWVYSEAITVKEGFELHYDLSATVGMTILAFFNAAGALVDRVDGAGVGGRHTGVKAVPAGAVEFRFSAGNGDTYGSATPNTIYYKAAVAAGIAAPANAEVLDGNLALYASLPGYINNAGAVGNAGDTNWARTPPIPCKGGRYLAYDGVGTGPMNLISAYNAAGQLVGSVPGVNSNQRSTGVYKLPADAASMVLNFGNFDKPGGALGWAQGSFVTRFHYSVAYPVIRMPIMTGLHWLFLYGDSRSSGDYPWLKSVWAEQFNCNVALKGWSGHTSSQLASNADLASVFDDAATPRMIVFMPGGNDNGAAGSVGTFSASSANGASGEPVVQPLPIGTDVPPAGSSMLQCVDLALQKMIARWSNVRTRAGIVAGDTEAQRAAKLDAIWPVEIVTISDLPQQRNNAADPFSDPANHLRKRRAILEASAYRRVRCIDFQGRYPIDMSLEPYFTLPTDKVNNNGVNFNDGLHQNRFLARRMAEMTAGDTGYY